jgi:formylglycine-generating enzyme required for sulfatase activity
LTTCGAGGAGSESCCTTRQEIPSGTFDRSYDGLSSGFTMAENQATVSAFRLDAYEVTVGRFRLFVSAVETGWLPAAGSGIHTHLNGGHGLNAPGGNETGWDSSWNSNLAKTANGWNANLSGGTWTVVPAKNENLAIAGINWFEAYAFCIWDQGFLPSEAEWNDAAAGGSEQRSRPWSTPYPPGSTSISCTEANFSGCPARAVNAVGSESPPGDGRATCGSGPSTGPVRTPLIASIVRT